MFLTQYVRELVSYLKNVQKVVETHHARVRDEQQTTKYRQLGPGTSLAVGDYVLVRKEHDHGVSYRFQDRHFDEPFQIVEAHGAGADAKVYTVSNLRGSRDNLGFTQPVALERLTPIELLPLAQVNETEPTRIRVDCGGSEKSGTVTSQSMDGKVYITFDGDDKETCVDLASTQYY